MTAIINIVLAILPALRQYFTKNAGLNSVSASWLVVVGDALYQNQGSVDQAITWAQNQGQYGVYLAAAVTAARTAIFFLRAARA